MTINDISTITAHHTVTTTVPLGYNSSSSVTDVYDEGKSVALHSNPQPSTYTDAIERLSPSEIAADPYGMMYQAVMDDSDRSGWRAVPIVDLFPDQPALVKCYILDGDHGPNYVAWTDTNWIISSSTVYEETQVVC